MGESEIAIRFGENLRRARRRADLSQERFAALAGLHRVEVGHLEHGRRRPRIDTLVKVACALGVPVDELLDGIDWLPGHPESGSGSFRVAPVGLPKPGAGACRQEVAG